MVLKWFGLVSPGESVNTGDMEVDRKAGRMQAKLAAVLLCSQLACLLWLQPSLHLHEPISLLECCFQIVIALEKILQYLSKKRSTLDKLAAENSQSVLPALSHGCISAGPMLPDCMW